MYAKLGEIVFEKLKSINDFSKSSTANYAEHKTIAGKPRLQPVGGGLDEITLSMRLHAFFCNPVEELKKLVKYKDTNEILPLSFGEAGKEGDFVITSINNTIEESGFNGTIFSYMVNCSLKEYVVPDPLHAAAITNRKEAAAVGDKNPVTKRKTNPPRCPKEIASLVMKIDNRARDINAIVLQKGGLGDSFSPNRSILLFNLQDIKQLSSTLMTKADDPNNCAHQYPDIKYRALQVYNEQINFTTAVNMFSIGGDIFIANHNKILQACVRHLKTAAAPLIKKSITPVS